MDENGLLIHDWPRLVGLSGIESRIAAADRILLFLDFDGTLAPIVPDPHEARLPLRAREAMTALVRQRGVTLAIVSGRSLSDVRSRVELEEAIYAGNHGFEIAGRGLSFVHSEATRECPLVNSFERELLPRVREIPGVLVENKGLSLSVHYRRVTEADVPALASAVNEVYKDFTQHLEELNGLKIFEFRPRVGWNKGSAVTWIRQKTGNGDAVAIYLGDDRTDEDAFAVLPDDITIHVGDARATSAGYRLAGSAEVQEFLEWLLQVRRRR